MLPSGLDEQVGDEEYLARFLVSSSLFSSAGVKAAAFLPNPANGETSVFRHGLESLESLWRIAAEHLGANRTVHGAALVQAIHVRSAGLQVAAKEPPPRHANIVGWPRRDDDPILGKAACKERALMIAQYAELIRR